VTDGYGRLVELAARERDLIDAGRYDELAELDAERGRLVASLPADPPPEARPALERAAALQDENTRLLTDALAQTRDSILGVGRGRTAARSYAGAPAGRGGGLVDTHAG
jgi:hypothetical protein